MSDLLCASPDSGVGAGIDSYYEYLLKAYVLLGDDLFLQRFNIVSIPTEHSRLAQKELNAVVDAAKAASPTAAFMTALHLI